MGNCPYEDTNNYIAYLDLMDMQFALDLKNRYEKDFPNYIVLLQMELEKSISRVSHFLIVQLRCNFNRIFT